MNGIVMPGANVIYNAVGTTGTAGGAVEIAPHNDKEWAAVGTSAAALVESGNLLLLGGRAVDKGHWLKIHGRGHSGPQGSRDEEMPTAS
jgi:hypothetical protein